MTIRWVARCMAIAFILFVSAFALDVFGESDWLLALIIHLIPSYILIALTAVAWKMDIMGGILFLVVGIIFMAVTRLEGYVLYVPAFTLGLLFLVSGWLKNQTYRQ